MLGLKSWIEAQLKRGYSKEQVKKALVRKGYSLKAVAEVDRVEVSTPQKLSKKSPGNKLVWAILIVGAVLSIWILSCSI